MKFCSHQQQYPPLTEGKRLSELGLDSHEQKCISHTPLVTMSSWPPTDLYCKFKANTSSITLKTGNKRKKFNASTLYWYCIKTQNLWVGGWESRQWRTQQKQLPAQRSHDLYPAPSGAWEKHFSLISFHSASKKLLLFSSLSGSKGNKVICVSV